MADLRVTTTTGQETALAEAAVNQFRGSLRGELILPHDHGYDEARTLWNAMIRRPALIARCAGATDVITAVHFARAHSLLVAVRGGGHSFPGNSVQGAVLSASGWMGCVGAGRRRTQAQTWR